MMNRTSKPAKPIASSIKLYLHFSAPLDFVKYPCYHVRGAGRCVRLPGRTRKRPPTLASRNGRSGPPKGPHTFLGGVFWLSTVSKYGIIYIRERDRKIFQPFSCCIGTSRFNIPTRVARGRAQRSVWKTGQNSSHRGVLFIKNNPFLLGSCYLPLTALRTSFTVARRPKLPFLGYPPNTQSFKGKHLQRTLFRPPPLTKLKNTPFSCIPVQNSL